MKKILLACLAAGIAFSTNAQQRLSLYEEFSGENCAPCAATNPGLWTLLSANTSKILLIKYQVPIPSAGPIYNLYPTVAAARRSYYGVNSAPSGQLDGAASSPTSASPGHPGYFTQAEINSGQAISSPFNLSVNHSWNATGDSVTATVDISAVSAFAPTGGTLKLRMALIEHLEYCAPPGNNGEKEFHNVVREMYPDAGGTAIANSWTVGQSQTLTLKGKVPSWVNKANDRAVIVVWIQNDGDKKIAQAAQSTVSTLTKDAALTGCPAPILSCTATSASVSPAVTLKNTGTTPLTSATIYYKLDATGTYTSYNWTGSLAAGASTNVNMPAMTVSGGSHVIYDSLANPNGSADLNAANNNVSTTVTVRSTNGVALPINSDFEASVPANWILYDENNDGQNFVRVWYGNTSRNIGHANSKYTVYFDSYSYPAGETDYVILPAATMPGGAASLDFWLAYAQYSAQYSEQLDVVYSTNCGSSWTSLWSKSGADLATIPMTTTAYIPVEADWRLKSVDVSSVPSGAMIALRAISGNGNRIFLDDINLRAGTPTGISSVILNNEVSLFPNPAHESTTVKFTLKENTAVSVLVFDAMGRVVTNVASQQLQKGTQSINVNTANLASGIYNLKIQTEAGSTTQRFTVVK